MSSVGHQGGELQQRLDTLRQVLPPYFRMRSHLAALQAKLPSWPVDGLGRYLDCLEMISRVSDTRTQAAIFDLTIGFDPATSAGFLARRGRAAAAALPALEFIAGHSKDVRQAACALASISAIDFDRFKILVGKASPPLIKATVAAIAINASFMFESLRASGSAELNRAAETFAQSTKSLLVAGQRLGGAIRRGLYQAVMEGSSLTNFFEAVGPMVTRLAALFLKPEYAEEHRRVQRILDEGEREAAKRR